MRVQSSARTLPPAAILRQLLCTSRVPVRAAVLLDLYY